MNLFVFIANAWGAVSGGINCFNYDLATACSRVVKSKADIKICCVVPDISKDEKKEMKEKDIIPITCSIGVFDTPEAARLISEKIKGNNKLRHYYPERCNTFCIGHDIYSGRLSKLLAEECNGWNIVFHHMDYSSYYLFKNSDAVSYNEKIDRQKHILCDANLVCAVGPKLKKSAQGIVRAKKELQTIEIFPGLADFNSIEEPDDRFSPIVFGRVEEDNQRVKQTVLPIDAFAKAIKLDDELEVIGNDAKLKIVGYEKEKSLEEEVERLQKKAEKIAGVLCNIVPVAYKTNREELGELISEASVAMMLSFHEGFGLAGYEAIAAGVPLILSENTGLYMFLKNEHLDNKVYPVKINGSTKEKGYSESDLNSVATALRAIRKKENEYKKDALELREYLRTNKKYSWDAVAEYFINKVMEQFESELENETTVFYSREQLTKLNSMLNDSSCKAAPVELSAGKHVFTVEGENSLASLYKWLEKEMSEKYSILCYNVQSGEENSLNTDFLSDCRAFFGKKQDYKSLGFQYVLAERLNETILVLNDFPVNSGSDFYDLFDLLNDSEYNFYIFTVFETDSPVMVKPYNKTNMSSMQGASVATKPIPMTLTDEQKLLVKILSFRGKMGYSKKLIGYICDGINQYCDANNQSSVFEDTVKIEETLMKLGMIEEYSVFSYQNSNIYLPAATELEVESEKYALGISKMGRFYARCYYLNRNRDPQLRWGYFSCKCFARAAELSEEIKKDIKTDYEAVLTSIRKKAMETSDYSRYHSVLQKFIDEYQKPDYPWIWYNYIHCESIFCPSEQTLNKAHNILESEIPAINEKTLDRTKLQTQFIRLCAELEHELDKPEALSNLERHVTQLSDDSKVGTSWAQCLSTFVSIAADRKEYNLANKYLDEYRKISKSNDRYQQVIATAMETNLKIAQYRENSGLDLSESKSAIERAFYRARDGLRDYRAQGWTRGLWGECQVLLNEQNGEENLRKSMEHRKMSGEKTKEYRNWLERISKYDLQQNTREFLTEEFARVSGS